MTQQDIEIFLKQTKPYALANPELKGLRKKVLSSLYEKKLDTDVLDKYIKQYKWYKIKSKELTTRIKRLLRSKFLSKSRSKILRTFVSNPNSDYYVMSKIYKQSLILTFAKSIGEIDCISKTKSGFSVYVDRIRISDHKHIRHPNSLILTHEGTMETAHGKLTRNTITD